MALRLLLGRATRPAPLCSSLRRTSSNVEGKSEPIQKSPKKSKLPVGRLDEPEESNREREPLEKLYFLHLSEAVQMLGAPTLLNDWKDWNLPGSQQDG
ncbi:unnamed protein product [Caretta caretta]